MKVEPIAIPATFKYYRPTFGILVGKPVKKVYAQNCWNEVSEGKFKDCTFTIYQNFVDNQKGSTLIIYRKFGTWIKSKLKYFNGNKKQTLWSYADGKKNLQ